MSTGIALPPSYSEAQQYVDGKHFTAHTQTILSHKRCVYRHLQACSYFPSSCSCDVLVARRKVQAVSPPPRVDIRETSVVGGADHFNFIQRPTPSPVPPSNPIADYYEQMHSMGFSRELSERALAHANGDPQRAIELSVNGQVQEQASTEREISEAMNRLRDRPPNDNLATSVFMELPKKKKTVDGWILAKIQEAMTLYNIQTNEGAAELCRDVWTDKLTLDKLAQDSSQQAFSFQEAEPLVRRQSAKAQCAFCFEDFSVSMMYVRMCERQDPSSAHGGAAVGGGAAAGLAEACRICYSCLFDGLFTQFKDCQLPQCIVCKTPMHQTAFNECMSILGANFSDKLGGNGLNNQVCTCGFLEKALWKGSAAQNPESIKKHSKECSFAITKRMKNQADDIIMQSALAGNEFMVACPGAGCKSYVEVAVMENPKTRKLVKVRECVRCSSCRTSFCPKCGATPYHFNTQCEEIATLRGEYTEWMTRGRQAFLRQRAEMDASFRKQLQDYEADKARVEAEKRQLEVVAQQAAADEAYKAQNCKMCPSCGRIVQKTGGCDSMVCGQDAHGGNKQQGCGHSFSWPSAPAYRAQDVQPRQIQFNREQPQQMIHRWLLCPDQDQNCDACAGPIVGPKFTCINCESLTICATCESLGPQALQGRLNKANFGAHATSHTFMVEMPPDI